VTGRRGRRGNKLLDLKGGGGNDTGNSKRKYIIALYGELAV